MKNTLAVLLLIFMVLFSINHRESLVLLESVPVKASVAVYYDSHGNKYVYVKGYRRKDGTYVKGYYRSMPNRDKSDNWSAKGNVNPFTGKKGYEKVK